MKRNQPGGAQGRVCQLKGTDYEKPQTQDDQVYEELNIDKCGWRVRGEPGEVGRGWTTQDLMGRNGESHGWVFKRVN